MGTVGSPEMSVRNYCYLLRNNLEECSCHSAVFGFHVENPVGIGTGRNYAHKWTVISVSANLQFS